MREPSARCYKISLIAAAVAESRSMVSNARCGIRRISLLPIMFPTSTSGARERSRSRDGIWSRPRDAEKGSLKTLMIRKSHALVPMRFSFGSASAIK